MIMLPLHRNRVGARNSSFRLLRGQYPITVVCMLGFQFGSSNRVAVVKFSKDVISIRTYGIKAEFGEEVVWKGGCG